MSPTTTTRVRIRALSRPAGVVLVCALALPQALAHPSERPAARVPRLARIVAAQARPAVAAGADVLFERVASHTTAHLAHLAHVALLRRLPPLTVRRVIAAGTRIARMPYHWGGGHGNWDDSGYDCSGSVSYALHGGGLLSVALDSSGLMSWGDPGPGRWITVYANGGHAFMVVAGRRFDTSGREQTGSRWQDAMRDTSGYVVRHPHGL